MLIKDDKLFEVDGAHCSCYGLEDQFEPKEVNIKELSNRLINGNFGKDSYCGNEFNLELRNALGIG